MKITRNIYAGLTIDFTGRLGRATRDGLIAIGISVLVAFILGATLPGYALQPLANTLGLDAVEHEWVLRQVSIGALSTGASEFGGIVGIASLLVRTLISISLRLWNSRVDASVEVHPHA